MKIRLLLLCGLLALAACASLPTEIPPTVTTAPQLTVVSLDTATAEVTPMGSLEDLRAERFAPILLTLDDFPEGIDFSEASLRDSTTSLILSLVEYSDAIGYAFDQAGSDYLGGVTGFLDDEELLAAFDANLESNVATLATGFADSLADAESADFTQEEQAYMVELSAADMPGDLVWQTEFVKANERLIRLDVLAFRRESVGVYLIYISSPTREPLIDFTDTVRLLEGRIQEAQLQ